MGSESSGWLDVAEGVGKAAPAVAVAVLLGLPTVEQRLYFGHSVDAIDGGIMSGGVPKDGIPSIDEPKFTGASDAPLDPSDPVFGAVRDGVAKAYPQKILVHHEIVNDRLAGDPWLLSGVVCCGPTILFVVGIQASAGIITLFQWVLPIAVVALVGTLLWVGSQVQPDAV